MNELKLLRWTGIAGILGAVLLFIGDMFLFGSWLSGKAALAENWHLMSRFSTLRLMIGGVLGPLSVIFYLFGCWHLYLALKPGGKLLSFLVFFNFASAILVGGALQAVSACLGLVYSFQNNLATQALDLLAASMKQYTIVLFTISQILAVIGTLFFIFLIVFKRTRYPRWMALLNPPCIIFTRKIAQFLPAPFGGNVLAGYMNLGFLVIFGVSVWILWNKGYKLSPQKTRQPDMQRKYRHEKFLIRS